MTGELRPVVEAGPGEPPIPLPEALRRSAEVYREEADCLDATDPRRDEVLARAAAFDDAAVAAARRGAHVDPAPARGGAHVDLVVIDEAPPPLPVHVHRWGWAQLEAGGQRRCCRDCGVEGPS